MKIIQEISENEMIASFLAGEMDSPRFKKRILEKLERDNTNRNIVIRPMLSNEEDCMYRKNLLKELRGYPDQKIFEDFPSNMRWYRAILSKGELRQAKYINYDYWVELSGGTRLPQNAAKNIKKGVEIFKQSNDNFLKVAEAFKRKARFPELIFVAENENATPIILEGHLRMTAMMLEESLIPATMEVIIGFSKNLPAWSLF